MNGEESKGSCLCYVRRQTFKYWLSEIAPDFLLITKAHHRTVVVTMEERRQRSALSLLRSTIVEGKRLDLVCAPYNDGVIVI